MLARTDDLYFFTCTCTCLTLGSNLLAHMPDSHHALVVNALRFGISDKGGEAFKLCLIWLLTNHPDVSLLRHSDDVFAGHACPLARSDSQCSQAVNLLLCSLWQAAQHVYLIRM